MRTDFYHRREIFLAIALITSLGSQEAMSTPHSLSATLHGEIIEEEIGIGSKGNNFLDILDNYEEAMDCIYNKKLDGKNLDCILKKIQHEGEEGYGQ